LHSHWQSIALSHQQKKQSEEGKDAVNQLTASKKIAWLLGINHSVMLTEKTK